MTENEITQGRKMTCRDCAKYGTQFCDGTQKKTCIHFRLNQKNPVMDDKLQYLRCDDWLVFALDVFTMQTYYLNMEMSCLWGDVPTQEDIDRDSMEKNLVPLMRKAGYFQDKKVNGWTRVSESMQG